MELFSKLHQRKEYFLKTNFKPDDRRETKTYNKLIGELKDSLPQKAYSFHKMLGITWSSSLKKQNVHRES